MPVFRLYLAKLGGTGPQLRPHNSTSSCAAPLPPPALGTSVASMVGLWPATCGDGTEVRTSKYRLREGGRDMTMNSITDWVTGSGDSDRPMLDDTGLNGMFDFVLEFDPESRKYIQASDVLKFHVKPLPTTASGNGPGFWTARVNYSFAADELPGKTERAGCDLVSRGILRREAEKVGGGDPRGKDGAVLHGELLDLRWIRPAFAKNRSCGPVISPPAETFDFSLLGQAREGLRTRC